MIGLDTNVLVRYIMQDDPRQSPLANRLIDALTPESPGFVALTSVIELVWVLSGSYGLRRDQIAQTLEVLLRSPQLMVDGSDQVLRALHRFRASKAEFADCLIERTAAAAGCARTMTFDVAASKTAGMTLM